MPRILIFVPIYFKWPNSRRSKEKQNSISFFHFALFKQLRRSTHEFEMFTYFATQRFRRGSTNPEMKSLPLHKAFLSLPVLEYGDKLRKRKKDFVTCIPVIKHGERIKKQKLATIRFDTGASDYRSEKYVTIVFTLTSNILFFFTRCFSSLEKTSFFVNCRKWVRTLSHLGGE